MPWSLHVHKWIYNDEHFATDSHFYEFVSKDASNNKIERFREIYESRVTKLTIPSSTNMLSTVPLPGLKPPCASRYIRYSSAQFWGGWGCEVSYGGHHRLRGKTTTGSALDGAVFDIAQLLAYLIHHMSRSQFYFFRKQVRKDIFMMTSSNGNIFRVTGPLCEEFTKASDAELWRFLLSVPGLSKRLSKYWWGWWFETPWRPLWRQFIFLAKFLSDEWHTTYMIINQYR